jgi:hypothetical protein
MRFSYVSLLLILYAPLFLIAQPQTSEFNYGGSGNEFGSSIATDGQYCYLVGQSNSFTSSTSDGIIQKVDTLGNTIWATSFGSNRREIGNVAIWDDYTRSIYTLGTTTSSSSSGIDDIMMVAFSESGNYVRKAFLGNSGDEHLFGGALNQYGHILATGNGYDNNYLGKMALLDTLGNVKWMKGYDYGNVNSEAGYRTWAVGEYFMVAGRTTNGWGVSGENDPILMKIDTTGGVIWAKKYQTHGLGYHSVRGGGTTDKGSFLLNEYDSAGISQVVFFKVDSVGNIAWGKKYQYTDDISINTAYETQSGNYLLVGVIASGAGAGDDGLMIEVDNLGNIIWANSYGGSQDDAFRDAVELDDGFMAVGYTYSFSNGGADIYMVRTDANGNMSSGCYSPGINITAQNITIPEAAITISSTNWSGNTNWSISTSDITTGMAVSLPPCGVLEAPKSAPISEIQNENLKTKIYPNPARDIIYFDGLSEILTGSVFDLSGNEVMTFSSSEYVLLSDLPNGLYIIRVIMPDGGVIIQKILLRKD